MSLSSSGKDARPSPLRRGFESRQGRHVIVKSYNTELFEMVADRRLTAEEATDIMMMERELNMPFIIWLLWKMFG